MAQVVDIVCAAFVDGSPGEAEAAPRQPPSAPRRDLQRHLDLRFNVVPSVKSSSGISKPTCEDKDLGNSSHRIVELGLVSHLVFRRVFPNHPRHALGSFSAASNLPVPSSTRHDHRVPPGANETLSCLPSIARRLQQLIRNN